MAEEQSVSSLPVKPKRKKFLPVTMSIMILCIAWYWWWNRIVSDVKIFSPPEWAWLEGKTELMIIPGRDELLIHRSKRKTLRNKEKPNNDQPNPTDELAIEIEELVRNEQEREKYEQQNSIRLNSNIPTGGIIKSDYYYRYDPKSKKIVEVDFNSWNIKSGIITNSQDNYLTTLIPLKDRLFHNMYIKDNIELSRKTLQKKLLSPFIVECDRIRRTKFSQQKYSEDIYTGCIELYQSKGIEPTFNSLAIIVTSKVNLIQEIRFPVIFGGGAPDSSSSRQHYHQLLSLEDFSWIGDPLRIPFVTKMNGATPKVGKDLLTGVGWSYDERFVVYTGKVSFCIVEIDKQRNQK